MLSTVARLLLATNATAIAVPARRLPWIELQRFDRLGRGRSSPATQKGLAVAETRPC